MRPKNKIMVFAFWACFVLARPFAANAQTISPANGPSDTDKDDLAAWTNPQVMANDPALQEFNNLPAEVQSKFNTDATLLFLASRHGKKHPYRSMIRHIPTRDENGETYASVLVESQGGNPGLEGKGSLRVFDYGHNIFSADVPISRLAELASLPGVVRIEPSQYGRAMLDQSTLETNVRYVQQHCNLNGQGVVVGIVDSGIDVNHPDFQDAAGHSRIESYWDEGGPVSVVINPTPGVNEFKYPGPGSPASTLAPDLLGHGTHIAGIVAGNGNASNGQYAGVAPAASIIAVKALYRISLHTSAYLDQFQNTQYQSGLFDLTDTPHVLDGVSYVFGQAGLRPAVVNISLGFFNGPHDGSTIFETSLSNMVNANHLVVASVGNYSNTGIEAGYHVGGWVGPNQWDQLQWQWKATDTCKGGYGTLAIGQAIDGWCDSRDSYSIVIESQAKNDQGVLRLSGPLTFILPQCTGNAGCFSTITTPGGTVTALQQFWDPDNCTRLEVIYSKKAFTTKGNFTILFTDSDGPLDRWNPSPSKGAKGLAAGPYTIHIVRNSANPSGSGRVDMWNYAHDLQGVWGKFQPPFSGTYPYDDFHDSALSPATAKKIISVGSYVTRADTCAAIQDPLLAGLGALSTFSSWGPTADGRLKPEVSAPGEAIISTRSSQLDTSTL